MFRRKTLCASSGSTVEASIKQAQNCFWGNVLWGYKSDWAGSEEGPISVFKTAERSNIVQCYVIINLSIYNNWYIVKYFQQIVQYFILNELKHSRLIMLFSVYVTFLRFSSHKHTLNVVIASEKQVQIIYCTYWIL